MPKLTLNIADEHLPVFLAFLQTLPYVQIEDESPAQSGFSAFDVTVENDEYQSGQAEELNKELGDLFGE